MADRTSRQAPPPGAPRRAVRRNLFQGLTRRPTGTTAANANASTGMASTAPTSSSGNSAETLRLDVDVLSDGSAAPQGPLEIVVRDEHGEIELGELPTLVFDEADEAALDDREESKSTLFHLSFALRV